MGRPAKFQDKVTITINVEDIDKDRLARIARFQKKSSGAVLRELLENYLDQYEGRNVGFQEWLRLTSS